MECEILINGEVYTVPSDGNISEALKIAGISDFNGIALAINGDVIPKNDWAQVTIKNKDSLLIVSATQGG